jgi:16S rRNA (cytosine967-C5)-methyltransferase
LEDVHRFPALQRQILQNALEHLRPGGRLVYSTCSLEREENEEVVAGLPVVSTLTRLPGREPGDGFFLAVISFT